MAHHQVRTDLIFIRIVVLLSLAYDVIDVVYDDNFAIVFDSYKYIFLL